MAPQTTSTTSPVVVVGDHAWSLAKKRLIAMLSSAAFTRRFVGVSALAMCAFVHYPLAEPTSDFSLNLAQGSDSVALDRRDAFAINVRKVAARIGVKNPENLSIRVGEETNGASLGANLTIGSRGACIVLPLELYEAFHATPEMRQQYDIPTKDEINFVLAHESAHIARNHSIISGTMLPASLVASCYLIKKIPNKLVAGVFGCLSIIGANTLVSWRLEHEADHIAAENGFAHGGINCFERKLGDAAHPLLTTRIEHLKRIADSTPTHHSCGYCFKV